MISPVVVGGPRVLDRSSSGVVGSGPGGVGVVDTSGSRGATMQKH